MLSQDLEPGELLLNLAGKEMLHLQSDLNTLMKPQNTPPCVVSWMDKRFLTTHPPTQRTVRVRQASLWGVDLGFCPEIEILGIGINLGLSKNFSVSARLHILAFPYHRVLLGDSRSPCMIARPICTQDPMAQAVSFNLQSWVLCRAQSVACGCGIPRERPDSAGTNSSAEGTQTFANKGV